MLTGNLNQINYFHFEMGPRSPTIAEAVCLEKLVFGNGHASMGRITVYFNC
jgi:hypothetical protein